MRVNLAKRETGIFSLNWIRIGVTILIIVLLVGLAYNYYSLITRKDILDLLEKNKDKSSIISLLRFFLSFLFF